MYLTRGERLLRLRKAKGVEQQEAAAAIGISAPYLSLLERDKKGRNIDHLRATLERAANYYGTLPAYLLADTPQDYMKAFVRQIGDRTPHAFGERLGLVLAELEYRWGEEFSKQGIASALGTTVEILKEYLEGRARATEDVVARLSQVTGTPVEWLVPVHIDPPAPDYEMQRVVEYAKASGMEAGDLRLLIDTWLLARNKKPSG